MSSPRYIQIEFDIANRKKRQRKRSAITPVGVRPAMGREGSEAWRRGEDRVRRRGRGGQRGRGGGDVDRFRIIERHAF